MYTLTNSRIYFSVLFIFFLSFFGEIKTSPHHNVLSWASSMTSCIPPTPCWCRFLTQWGPLQVQTHWCLHRAGAQRRDEDYLCACVFDHLTIYYYFLWLRTARSVPAWGEGVAWCTLRVNMHNELGKIPWKSLNHLLLFDRKQTQNKDIFFFFYPSSCSGFHDFFFIHQRVRVPVACCRTLMEEFAKSQPALLFPPSPGWINLHLIRPLSNCATPWTLRSPLRPAASLSLCVSCSLNWFFLNYCYYYIYCAQIK